VPRKRTVKENKGLPKRWMRRHGAYFYRPAEGEKHRWDNKGWYRLGATLAEAHAEFAKRAEFSTDVGTMQQLCDRYESEVLPRKAPATQKNQRYSLARIRKVFGGQPVDAIEPTHCYQFRDSVARNYSENWANKDLQVLSHLFTKANEWGARSGHPMTNKQVTKFSQNARTRYVTDAELAEFRENFAGPFLDTYLELKGLTALRKADLLAINLAAFQDSYLRVVPRKTQDKKPKPLLFKMTPEMTAAIAAIKALPRPVSSVWLFSTRKGQPYINFEDGQTSSFDSIWQHRMKKFVDAGNEHFTEHDLRAKAGSEVQTTAEAQELLNHSSAAITEKVYRRKGKVITPTKDFRRD
jgi:integrase